MEGCNCCNNETPDDVPRFSGGLMIVWSDVGRFIGEGAQICAWGYVGLIGDVIKNFLVLVYLSLEY